MASTLEMVEIPEGVHKYVLIKIVSEINDEKKVKYLVRGRAGAGFHADSAAPTLRLLKKMNVKAVVEGGGRIAHDKSKKTILIYGHSIGFPWENGIFKHYITKRLCEEAFDDSYRIDFKNEGY